MARRGRKQTNAPRAPATEAWKQFKRLCDELTQVVVGERTRLPTQTISSYYTRAVRPPAARRSQIEIGLGIAASGWDTATERTEQRRVAAIVQPPPGEGA